MAQPLIKIKKSTIWLLCALCLVAIVWNGSSSVYAQGVPPSANEPGEKIISDKITPDSDMASPDSGKASPDADKVSPDFDKASPDSDKASPDFDKVMPDSDTANPDFHKVSPDSDKATPDFDKVSPDSDKTNPDFDKASPDSDKVSPDFDRASPDSDKISPDFDRASHDSDKANPDSGKFIPDKVSPDTAFPHKTFPHKALPHKVFPAKVFPAKDAHKKVSMDFDNVDIRLVIKFMSELTGKNFILDDRVKGKVTVLSPTEIPVKDAYRIFESILEVNGYTTVTSGNVIKVIPDNNAASKNLETISGESPRLEEDNSDTMVTQIIPLEFADVERVKSILQPLISRESKILSYLPTNTLILTERVSNIKRLMTILKEIDVETENTVIEIIFIQHADADTIAKQLQTLFGERTSYYSKSQKTRAAQGGNKMKILPDSRTGNIIIMADPEQIEEIKDLIKQLDVPVPRDKDDIHVYFLRNAKADDMAKVLAQIMSKTLAKGGKDAKPDTPITVVSDKGTNSLIITASSVDYGVIERVLAKLDIMRPQVLVEALIAEVSYDKSKELGVEWRAMREPSEQWQPSSPGRNQLWKNQ